MGICNCAPAAPQCCLQESCPRGQRTRISSFHVWVLWLVRDFAVHRSTRRFGSFVFTMSAQALTQRCHGYHDSLVLCTAAQSLARLERKLFRAAMVTRPALPPPLQADRVAPHCGAIFWASVWAAFWHQIPAHFSRPGCDPGTAFQLTSHSEWGRFCAQSKLVGVIPQCRPNDLVV